MTDDGRTKDNPKLTMRDRHKPLIPNRPRNALLCGIACLLFVGLGCGPSGPKPGGPRVKPTPPRHTASNPVDAEDTDALDLTLVPGGIHEVRPRDTLEGLAERYYGSKRHWRKIWVANRNRLEDPHVLPVGMKLIIP